MALAEKEEAVAAAKRLSDKVAQLQEDAKDARVNADSKASEAVNGLRLKTFELESLQALYEQALTAQKELQTENAHLSGKLEKLTKDHFETKSGLERINAELRTESKTLADKLKVYENLEKEMDEVVMQCAELDDETQAEKVPGWGRKGSRVSIRLRLLRCCPTRFAVYSQHLYLLALRFFA